MKNHILKKENLTQYQLPQVALYFFGRIQGVELPLQKEQLRDVFLPLHKQLLYQELKQEGVKDAKKIPLVTLKQVHGNEVILLDPPEIFSRAVQEPPLEADGMLTTQRKVSLGVYVADCAPIWIIEEQGVAAAILHSGKKGTFAGILPRAIELFEQEYQIPANRLRVIVGPTIRPCCYDTDFVSLIHQQAQNAGVKSLEDNTICTACHPKFYYSYRRELGKTGRMLATVTLS